MKKENVIELDPHADTSTVIVFEKIEDLFFKDYALKKRKDHTAIKLYNLKYNYLFNLFNDNIEYDGKIIAGASIDIEFQIYYKNKPVYFIWDSQKEEYPQCKKIYLTEFPYKRPSYLANYGLSNFFSVRFNSNSGYSIFSKNKLLRPLEDVDYTIGITVSNFYIDTFTDQSKCISEPNEVSHEEFMKILKKNKEGFDCSDNIHAQSVSYGWRIIEL